MALYNKKYKVVEYLLVNDMIDIRSCSKRPIMTVNRSSVDTPVGGSSHYTFQASVSTAYSKAESSYANNLGNRIDKDYLGSSISYSKLQNY